jgi:hypothetical protein
MLDLHAVTSSGSTGSLGALSTIALGGDGATTAGVPISMGATLIQWGGMTTIADTIAGLKMSSLDQDDPVNGEDFEFGTSSLLGYHIVHDNLAYVKGARNISINQNTGAANNMGYTIDIYGDVQGKEPCVALGKLSPRSIPISSTFGGALTALTWGEKTLAPTSQLPQGKYAIEGFWANALTNYALIRFKHADFGGYYPGLPAIDMTNTAVANAVLPKDDVLLQQGYQFDVMSEMTGLPCCPVFNVGPTGTGLTIQALSITAPTPIVTLNLTRIA